MSGSDELRNRIAVMETARKKLEKDSEALLADAMPAITRFTEAVTAYRKEHGSPYDFWRSLGLYSMPCEWPNSDVSVEIDSSTGRVLQLRVVDRYDDEVSFYDYPWALFDDTDAFIAEQRAEWDRRYAQNQKAQDEHERKVRHATYLALHEEFGKSNPDQS